eukprot:408279_1
MPDHHNYWSKHYIACSFIVGCFVGIVLSMFLWLIHELYLMYRLHKYGIITDAKITHKQCTGLASEYNKNTTHQHSNHAKYQISYIFYHDQSNKIMKILFNIYCVFDIPNDITNLCLEFIGYDAYQYCYGPYITNNMEVSESVYIKCPQNGEFMKIKYDPKHPNNRIILDIGHGWSNFRSNITMFIITLIVVCISFWFIILDNEIHIDNEKMLAFILLMIIPVIIISVIIMIITCWSHKSFCFQKYNQTELQCNVRFNPSESANSVCVVNSDTQISII